METNERLHALDALRAFALFLGIYFHASLSYMPGLDEWVVTDSSTGPVIWLVSGFSHLFRMSLFFFIAGYFARLVYHRKGFELLRARPRQAHRLASPDVPARDAPAARSDLGVGRAADGQTHPRSSATERPHLPADAPMVSLLLVVDVRRRARGTGTHRQAARSLGAHQEVSRPGIAHAAEETRSAFRIRIAARDRGARSARVESGNGHCVSRQVAHPTAHTDGGLRVCVRRRLAVSAQHCDADDDGGANDIVAVDYVGLFRDHCSLRFHHWQRM